MLNFTTRLVAILTSLRQAVAAFAAQQDRAQATIWLGAQAYRPLENPNLPPRLPVETWTLLWHRLNRLAQRFQTLFTRWQTNTLPAPRPSRAGQPYTPRATPRLPTADGWVNIRIPEAAPCAGQLDALLQDAELHRFLAEAPQAGRLLRPLLRALGLQPPDCLKLPANPKPLLLSPRPPRGEPEGGSMGTTPDRPLPAYVRAAARAWKKFDT